MPETPLVALEQRSSISNAVRLLVEKFSGGAESISFHGLHGFWHESLSVWGAFNDPDGSGGQPSYSNPFGRIPHIATVEINPPRHGINTNVQGVIASAADGQRWILHQGRLHPPGRHLSENEFDAVANRDRVTVSFSDGRVVKYLPVANIDADLPTLQSQIAAFVSDCEVVRQHYVVGRKAAEQLSDVAAIEELFPETLGEYEVGAQEAKTVVKKHPNVWRQLHKEFSSRGIPCSNGRVARWGPDLRTLSKRPILFEIKSAESASELQRAVGQLLLYEALLKAPHLKILVYPQSEKSTQELVKALDKLDIQVLPYSRSGRVIRFDATILGKLIRYTKAEKL